MSEGPRRLRALSDWQVERIRDSANDELARRAAEDYVTLGRHEAQGADLAARDRVVHGALGDPEQAGGLVEGRASIVLLVHRGDVTAYEPRAYPRAERAS